MMKIVIADDSPVVRQRLAQMLNDLEGIEVVGQADDTPAAMELVERLTPDVAILDVRLPTGSGADLVREIKQLNPASRIIVLTSFPYPEVREKCLNGGADFFFDKSNEFQKVVSVVRSMIRAASEIRTTLGVNMSRPEEEVAKEVASQCSSFGRVSQVKLHLCRNSPLARPFAMVSMDLHEDTEKLAAAFGRHALGSSAIVFLRDVNGGFHPPAGCGKSGRPGAVSRFRKGNL